MLVALSDFGPSPRSFLFFYAMAHALFFLEKFHRVGRFCETLYCGQPSLIAFLTLTSSYARLGSTAERGKQSLVA